MEEITLTHQALRAWLPSPALRERVPSAARRVREPQQPGRFNPRWRTPAFGVLTKGLTLPSAPSGRGLRVALQPR